MTFVLLSLLGTALFGALAFDWFDGNDDDQNDEPQPDNEVGNDEPQPDNEIGQELSYDGSDLLEGTEGDDTLPAGQDSNLAPEEISLLGGNDTAIIEDPFDITVSGGEGDDTLSSAAVGNILDGGAGNDILTGIDANSMFGGSGDDQITFDSDVELNSSVARIDGGEGNDTINILADAGVNTADRGGAIVEGGTGADEFNIVLDLQNSTDEASILNTAVARIGDFSPSEDALVIEVDQNGGTIDRDVDVELNQTEENGTYTSLITLTFGETDNATQATATLTVFSAAPFTLDDIQLIGV